MEIKDASKTKKASVRFASTKRDPAANVITPLTMDLEPVINCLKSIEIGWTRWNVAGNQRVRQFRPVVLHLLRRRSRRATSGANRKRDRRATTPVTSACSSKTSTTYRRRTTPPVHSHAFPRHRQRDGEMMSVINLRRRRGTALDYVSMERHRSGLIPARGMVALSLFPHL